MQKNKWCQTCLLKWQYSETEALLQHPGRSVMDHKAAFAEQINF